MHPRLDMALMALGGLQLSILVPIAGAPSPRAFASSLKNSKGTFGYLITMLTEPIGSLSKKGRSQRMVALPSSCSNMLRSKQ